MLVPSMHAFLKENLEKCRSRVTFDSTKEFYLTARKRHKPLVSLGVLALIDTELGHAILAKSTHAVSRE